MKVGGTWHLPNWKSTRSQNDNLILLTFQNITSGDGNSAVGGSKAFSRNQHVIACTSVHSKSLTSGLKMQQAFILSSVQHHPRRHVFSLSSSSLRFLLNPCLLPSFPVYTHFCHCSNKAEFHFGRNIYVSHFLQIKRLSLNWLPNKRQAIFISCCLVHVEQFRRYYVAVL